MIQLKHLTQVTPEIVEAFNQLIPQLTPNYRLIDENQLKQIINTENTFLFIAYDTISDQYVGSITLIINYIPTGTKAWIEDVMVDAEYRNQGIGEQLVRLAIDFATQQDVKNINLTSSPSRIAANNLYKKIGFIERETNIYRYTLS